MSKSLRSSNGMLKVSVIKRKMNKLNASDDIIEYIENIVKERDEKILQLTRAIEIGNKKSLPVEERYLEIKTVDSSSSKMTINPCTGRVTLKFSDKASDTVKQELIEFTAKIIEKKFEPATMRGKFRFSEGKYKIVLQSNSRKFSRYFETE